VDVSELDYDLPDERIAQVPVEPRDAARLLVDGGPAAGIDHRHVHDLPDLLDPGDVVIVNTTRVLPARLHLVKETGGQAEVLLLEPRPDLGGGCWEALVRPGRRLPPGTVLRHPATASVLHAVVGDELPAGVRLVTLSCRGEMDLRDGIEDVGEIPLPPYIHAPIADPDRYQTVYADMWRSESVAAPTAGLHLTDDVIDRMARKRVHVSKVHLVIGLGTFRPIATEKVDDHVMHEESYEVPDGTLAACWAAHDRGNRVVAIGTTTVRALESAMATGELEGRTELFIRDPFEFQLVDRLLTNFHLPRSSLLAMIDAFVGPDEDGGRRWRRLYEQALASDYRFLSFGDAMLLTRPGAR
jgi:S-adenosylmethionine:tRNA ribosyltransferase-isomerase